MKHIQYFEGKFNRDIYNDQTILFWPSGELVTIDNKTWNGIYDREDFKPRETLDMEWDDDIFYWLINDDKRLLFDFLVNMYED